MNIGELFQVGANIYKVVDNPEKSCSECSAFGKQALCFKMPDCEKIKQQSRVKFKKLTAPELRKAKKNNTSIIPYK